MKSVFLNSFKTIKPKQRFSQNELLLWTASIHKLAEEQRPGTEVDISSIDRLFSRFGVKDSLISERNFECKDVLVSDGAEAQIYKVSKGQPNGVDIMERAQFFSTRAFEVIQEMYDFKNLVPRPQHLIHVTCTGYISPSAAQRAVAHSKWGAETDVTHAYHMGCYASLPSIRLASGLVNSSNEDLFTVDVIHNEMCGLHMNMLAHTPEQIIVQTLFADGHAKYSLSRDKAAQGGNFKLLSIMEKVIPDSELDMSWISGPYGMQMNLSREVPAKIKGTIMDFTSALFSKAGIPISGISEAIFAIHPGGPKIVSTVKECLSLSDTQTSESQKVLLERGNMSSATLPHVWELILQKNYPEKTIVVSFAFGPGLTVFGSVFEVC